MNSVVNGICPKINTNNTKLLWIDLDKRSQYCYWFSADYSEDLLRMGLVSWADASFSCKRRNGTLASIHSSHDLMLLSNKITNSRYNTWIGLHKTPNGLLLS
jgi:hypothetical protein